MIRSGSKTLTSKVIQSSTFRTRSTQSNRRSNFLSSSRNFSISNPHKMRVIPVPNQSDNYSYIIQDTSVSPPSLVFVDPFDLSKLKSSVKSNNLSDSKVIGNISTHHHQDHTGGNSTFSKEYPNAKTWGGSDKVPQLTDKIGHEDSFKFTNDSQIKVTGKATPCHTQDSVCFYLEDQRSDLPQGEVKRAVFTGDTLFISGCGRFFEGTPEEMHQALNIVLSSLPNDTVTYVGHEYTTSNVKFSSSVLPDREAINKLKSFCEEKKNNGVTTGIFTIGDEKEWNVFMLTKDQEVQKKCGTVGDEIGTMKYLREAKNSGGFKSKV